MVTGTHGVPDPQDDSGDVRPGLAALLIFAVGTALIVPVTSQFWPDSLLPANTGRADYFHNLRILKSMLVFEGLVMWSLALLVWRRPGFVQALAADDVLESQPLFTLSILFAVHTLGVLLFLPPQQILSNEPIYTADHAVHLYRAFGAQQLSFGGSGMEGYDPFVNAGGRWTLLPDSRGFEWFARGLSFVDLSVVGKLWVLFVEFLVPVVVWCSARLCGCRYRASWFAVALALTYWHGGRPFLGSLRWNGNHSYLLAALLAVLAVALGVRYLRSAPMGRLRTIVALWLLLAVLGFIHPLGLLIPAGPLLLLTVWGAWTLRAGERVALLLVPLSLTWLHSTWLWPLVRQRTLLPVPQPHLQIHGLQDLLALTQQTSLLPLLLIGALALVGGWKVRHRLGQLTIGMGALVVVCLALMTWGYGMPGVRRFETVRFLVPALLAACILAGEGAVQWTRWLRPRLGAALLMMLLVVGTTWPVFAAVLDSRFFYVHRVHAMLDTRFHRLMQRLQEAPELGARVLFQSTRRGWILPEGGDEALEALVPVFTHRQVVGLGHPSLTRGESDLAFLEGQLAGRHYSQWTTEDFETFLHNYDIATVVAWSSGARRFLSRFPTLLQAPEQFGDIQVFEVVDYHAMLAGKATVRASFNRIEIRNMSVETIILPYHWIEGMRSTPPVPISPAIVAGTPVPFLRIRNQGHPVIVLQR